MRFLRLHINRCTCQKIYTRSDYGAIFGAPKPCRKSTIDYFNPINQPFTEYSVIEELLKRGSAVDKTMEESFMTFAKSAGKISNLFIYTFYFYEKKKTCTYIIR